MNILAIDALEYNLVEEFNCTNLKQKFYGKTNISEFSEPRTIVLWSSFITGKNMEEDILSKGKEMWNFNIDMNNTFFRNFKNPKIIDLPGFNYDEPVHNLERKLLKEYFDDKSDKEKNEIKKIYNKNAFEHHTNIKKEFFESFNSIQKHDLILCYFSIADVVGHLNFGNRIMMKMIYRDLDEIAWMINDIDDITIIISDHGMKKIGMFGDHSHYGFWSTNFLDLKNPKITDFADIINNY